MINVKVENTHVTMHANGTGEELACDILRTMKTLYDKILEESKDAGDVKGAVDFRSTIILWIDDVLDYEKIEEV